MRNIAIAMATLATLALLASSPAQAQEMSATGVAAYVQKTLWSAELPDGSMGQRMLSTGFVFSDESSPFHNSAQTCVGSMVATPDGSTFTSRGYCDGMDPEGDVWWIWWSSSPEGGEWGLMGGTGKFEGMTGGGTTAPVAEYPDGRMIISWSGTWSH